MVEATVASNLLFHLPHYWQNPGLRVIGAVCWVQKKRQTWTSGITQARVWNCEQRKFHCFLWTEKTPPPSSQRRTETKTKNAFTCWAKSWVSTGHTGQPRFSPCTQLVTWSPELECWDKTGTSQTQVTPGREMSMNRSHLRMLQIPRVSITTPPTEFQKSLGQVCQNCSLHPAGVSG